MTKSVKKVDTDSNVSNERTNLIADAVNKVQGSNALINDAIREAIEEQGYLEGIAGVSEERANTHLSEIVPLLVEHGHTALDYTQAKAEDFPMGKDDAAFKGRKAFYDDAKFNMAWGLFKANERYGADVKYNDRAVFAMAYDKRESKLKSEGESPIVFTGISTVKAAANRKIVKIRARMLTIEKGDDKTPKVESTDLEKDIKDFQRLINRLLNREDLSQEEVYYKLTALQEATGRSGYNIEDDLKFDVE